MKKGHENNCRDTTDRTRAIAESVESSTHFLSPANKAGQNITVGELDPSSDFICQDDRRPQLRLIRTDP